MLGLNALATKPGVLFDANIFHPARTLLLSEHLLRASRDLRADSAHRQRVLRSTSPDLHFVLRLGTHLLIARWTAPHRGFSPGSLRPAPWRLETSTGRPVSVQYFAAFSTRSTARPATHARLGIRRRSGAQRFKCSRRYPRTWRHSRRRWVIADGAARHPRRPRRWRPRPCAGLPRSTGPVASVLLLGSVNPALPDAVPPDAFAAVMMVFGSRPGSARRMSVGGDRARRARAARSLPCALCGVVWSRRWPRVAVALACATARPCSRGWFAPYAWSPRRAVVASLRGRRASGSLQLRPRRAGGVVGGAAESRRAVTPPAGMVVRFYVSRSPSFARLAPRASRHPPGPSEMRCRPCIACSLRTAAAAAARSPVSAAASTLRARLPGRGGDGDYTLHHTGFDP